LSVGFGLGFSGKGVGAGTTDLKDVRGVTALGACEVVGFTALGACEIVGGAG